MRPRTLSGPNASSSNAFRVDEQEGEHIIGVGQTALESDTGLGLLCPRVSEIIPNFAKEPHDPLEFRLEVFVHQPVVDLVPVAMG